LARQSEPKPEVARPTCEAGPAGVDAKDANKNLSGKTFGGFYSHPPYVNLRNKNGPINASNLDSMPNTSASTGNQILIDCFRWRFKENAEERLAAFEAELNRTPLPFDLKSQLRILEYPGYPRFETGMPDAYHYFVPRSGWGSIRLFPSECLDPSFVYCTDGHGLNLGCPLRLDAALARGASLGHDSIRSCLDELNNYSKHLAAVEELLWADIWSPEAEVCRAVAPDAGRWHDWDVHTRGKRIRLEVKFHKSDWARLSDPHHLPIHNKILANASGQLRETGEHFNVVGITLIREPRPNYLAALEAELIEFPAIDAVILKSFAGEISVCSLSESIATEIVSSIDVRPADQFQLIYTFFENIAQKSARLAARPAEPPIEVPSNLCHIEVRNLPPRQTLRLPDRPYRMNIESRDPVTDEPHFKAICPYQ
jgi:hypothetical protein